MALNFISKVQHYKLKKTSKLEQQLVEWSSGNVVKYSFIQDEREGLQKLCKIIYVAWKWNMALERKRDGNFENRKSDNLRDVWCEAVRPKKQRGVDGHVE